LDGKPIKGEFLTALNFLVDLKPEAPTAGEEPAKPGLIKELDDAVSALPGVDHHFRSRFATMCWSQFPDQMDPNCYIQGAAAVSLDGLVSHAERILGQISGVKAW
jgi:hypothetical protein